MTLTYKGQKPKMDKNCWIAEGAKVIGEVEMGEDVSIWFNAVVRGDVHFIKIGNRSNIQDNSIVHVTHFKNGDKKSGNPTIIGDDVTVGHGVILHGCTIENACLIGMGSTILDGAVIGTESIVGANSLVTQNKVFPKRSLIMGSPAKVVRELTQEEVDELYASSIRYKGFKDNYLEGI